MSFEVFPPDPPFFVDGTFRCACLVPEYVARGEHCLFKDWKVFVFRPFPVPSATYHKVGAVRRVFCQPPIKDFPRLFLPVQFAHSDFLVNLR